MKIICVGKNYLDHVKEFDNKIPKEPIIFTKPDTAVLRKGFDFYIPDFSSNIHYEVEILVKICKVGKNIQAKFSHKYYESIGIGIDFTARDLQTSLKENRLPWALAKGFDDAAVISDFIPKEQYKDVQNINFSLSLNGEVKQSGNTKDMLFSIDKIIAYISKYITLKKGDIIYTGTPSGVGPVSVGDKIACAIENQNLINLEIK